MSYEPTTWVNGDIITATKMNNIESGVQSVSGSYTPTTWVNGDIITAQKMNNIEQGIANAGGGGSSDFSTANVTVVSDAHAFEMRLPYILDADGTAGISGSGITESGTYTIPMYKGFVGGALLGVSTVNIIGNAEYSQEATMIFVTGDCTITIS